MLIHQRYCNTNPMRFTTCKVGELTKEKNICFLITLNELHGINIEETLEREREKEGWSADRFKRIY